MFYKVIVTPTNKRISSKGKSSQSIAAYGISVRICFSSSRFCYWHLKRGLVLISSKSKAVVICYSLNMLERK